MIGPAPRSLTPAAAILAFTGLCLAAFWMSMLVPRPDGSLLGSDGTYYYAYLPSVLLDGDLDFSDDFPALLQGEPEKLAYSTRHLTPLGLPANQWSIGPAILWSPFFVLAHGVALLLAFIGVPVSTSGYGTLYQAFVLSGSILYGGAGLWFIYRSFAGIIETPSTRAAGVLLAAVGGNAVYYMTVEPHMSHAPSLFATGLFFWIWLAGRGRDTWWRAAALGGTAGLMALIRPQAGVFLVLPFIDRLVALCAEPGAGARRDSVGRLMRDAAIAILCSLIVFAPQLVVWKLLWGSFARSSYSLEGEGFYWTRPHLWATMFSAHRGLFVWNPMLLFGLVGLWLLRRRDPRLLIVLLLGFAIQWYLISSWWAWDQGKSFGGRMFIVCTPIFALGLALTVGFLGEHRRLRVGLAIAAILVACNAIAITLYVLAW